MAGAREILELVIKGDAKGAIEAFRGTEKAADGAEKATGKFGQFFDRVTTKFPVAGKVAEKFGLDAASAGTMAAGAATAAGGAIVAFAAKSVAAYTDLAGGVLQFQRASGASAEEASRFVAVMDDYEISAEQGSAAIGKFAKNLATAPDELAKLGVQIQKNADGTVNLQQTLENAADVFKNTTDVTKRAELGNKLFGKSWQDMVPLLEQGAVGLREAFEAVPKGQILDQKDIDSTEELRLQVDALKDAFLEMSVDVGRELLPVLKGAVTTAEGLAKAAGFIMEATSGANRARDVVEDPNGPNRRYLARVAQEKLEKEAHEAERARAAERQRMLSAEIQSRNANTKAAAEAADVNLVLSDSYQANETSARNADRVQQDVADTQKVLAERAHEYNEAIRKNADAAEHLAKAEKERADATRDAYRAAQESIDPILRERAANRELAKAADDVRKATDEAAKAKFNDAAKNAIVVEGQDDLVAKLADVAGAYVLAKGKALDSAEGSKLYVDKLKELRDQYGTQLGPAIAIYDELIRRIEAALRAQSELNRTSAGYNVGGGGDRGNVGAPKAFSYGGAAATKFVPDAAGVTVNLTVKVDAPVVTQQAAQWVADAFAVYIRTNGTGWLNAVRVATL